MITLKVIGILGATIAYLFIAASIVLSPWFSIYNNALSDLGNIERNGKTAIIYNAGLISSGLLIAVFALRLAWTKRSWTYLSWAIPLALAAADLSMIGFFPEDAGRIHGIVSAIFFGMIAITMLIYSYASWPISSPRIGAVALVFGIASVLVWAIKWPWLGVAIQETVTSAMAAIFLIMVSLKIGRSV